MAEEATLRSIEISIAKISTRLDGLEDGLSEIKTDIKHTSGMHPTCMVSVEKRIKEHDEDVYTKRWNSLRAWMIVLCVAIPMLIGASNYTLIQHIQLVKEKALTEGRLERNLYIDNAIEKLHNKTHEHTEFFFNEQNK